MVSTCHTIPWRPRLPAATGRLLRSAPNSILRGLRPVICLHCWFYAVKMNAAAVFFEFAVVRARLFRVFPAAVPCVACCASCAIPTHCCCSSLCHVFLCSGFLSVRGSRQRIGGLAESELNWAACARPRRAACHLGSVFAPWSPAHWRLVHRSRLQTLSEGCPGRHGASQSHLQGHCGVPAEGEAAASVVVESMRRGTEISASQPHWPTTAGNMADLRPALSADILLAPNQKSGELRGHGRYSGVSKAARQGQLQSGVLPPPLAEGACLHLPLARGRCPQLNWPSALTSRYSHHLNLQGPS